MSAWIEGLRALSDGLVVLGLVFFPFELWRRVRLRALGWGYVLEVLANVTPFVVSVLLGGAVLAFLTWLYRGVSSFALWSIETNLWSVLLCLVLVDLFYYWDHRLGHRVRAYWAISHSVHHSSPIFDQTTALRISFVDGFLSIWLYLVAVLLGFEPMLVLVCLGVILGYQQWIHTETVGLLGPLEGILNTPSAHRVHHGVQPQYIDKNYGAILMVWDRLFGTYAPEVEPVIYGLTDPIPGRGPWEVHLCEAKRLWASLRAAGSWRMRWALLWRPPGWSPALNERGDPPAAE